MANHKIILVLFSTIFLITASYPQNDLPEKVVKCVDFLSSYTDADKFRSDMESLSLDSLKSITKMMYEADETDAFLKYVYFKRRQKESNSAIIQNSSSSETTFITPSQVHFLIIKEIREKLSPLTEILVNTDYLLKAEILSVKKSAYYPKDLKYAPPLPKINVTVRILEFIKGDNRYSIGDTLTFFYMAIYRSADLFSAGDICLLPLQIGHNDEATLSLNYQIDPHTEHSESKGYLPVTKGELIDRDNYFGFGEKVEWEEFNSHLLKNIEEIKSW